jgi:hypothetical protein
MNLDPPPGLNTKDAEPNPGGAFFYHVRCHWPNVQRYNVRGAKRLHLSTFDERWTMFDVHYNTQRPLMARITNKRFAGRSAIRLMR